MKKPSIPALAPGPTNTYNVLAALKENVEQLTGMRGGQIQALPATATLPEVVAKVNEIIDRMMNK